MIILSYGNNEFAPKTSQHWNKQDRLIDNQKEVDNLSIYYEKAYNKYEKEKQRYRVKIMSIKSNKSQRTDSFKANNSNTFKEVSPKDQTDKEQEEVKLEPKEDLQKENKVKFGNRMKSVTSPETKSISKI